MFLTGKIKRFVLYLREDKCVDKEFSETHVYPDISAAETF